jgi:hypothetical protein
MNNLKGDNRIMKPDLKYVPAEQWKKKDSFTAVALDGSKVWIDIRGFLGYERPDSYYVTFGINIHNLNNKEVKSITLYRNQSLELRENGYSTGYILENDLMEKFYKSIVNAIKELGYRVEIEIKVARKLK